MGWHTCFGAETSYEELHTKLFAFEIFWALPLIFVENFGKIFIFLEALRQVLLVIVMDKVLLIIVHSLYILTRELPSLDSPIFVLPRDGHKMSSRIASVFAEHYQL